MFRRLLLPILFLVLAAPAWPRRSGPFLVEPYLQLGADPGPDRLSLVWQGPDRAQDWAVAVRLAPGRSWVPVPGPRMVRVAVPATAPHRVYFAALRQLVPGAAFSYRIALGGRVVFQSHARALPGPGQRQRVAVVGDLAEGHGESRLMAWRLAQQRPDLVLVPGDVVYQGGRISEYRRNFFPVFNAGLAGPHWGAPLLRTTVVAAALGNHDVGERGPRHPVAEDPDGMAYYLYWDQPTNGPRQAPGPPLRPGPGWTWDGFRAAAGAHFPAMGSYSFDSGSVHWTVLDSNPYVRWDEPALQAWLERDLAAAAGASWRFVVFHHPAFSMAEGHRYRDQWMGRIWPILERHRVDLVFCGHIHIYARTRPIRFTPDPASVARLDPRTQQGQLEGRLVWDTGFDGHRRTRADGIIQILTGGGGAQLRLRRRSARLRPHPYVARLVADEHSFSLLDIQPRKVVFRQLDIRGRTLDRFTVTR